MRSQEDIEFVKKNFPGFIGGEKIVNNATDAEIIALIDLQDEIARLHNAKFELEKTRGRIQTQIRKRAKA